MLALLTSDEFLDRETDVAGDLPQQGWGDVAAGVQRDRSAAPVRVPKLRVRAALPDLHEAAALQQSQHLARLQDGRLAPHEARCRLGHEDGLHADELRL